MEEGEEACQGKGTAGRKDVGRREGGGTEWDGKV